MRLTVNCTVSPDFNVRFDESSESRHSNVLVCIYLLFLQSARNQKKQERHTGPSSAFVFKDSVPQAFRSLQGIVFFFGQCCNLPVINIFFFWVSQDHRLHLRITPLKYFGRCEGFLELILPTIWWGKKEKRKKL